MPANLLLYLLIAAVAALMLWGMLYALRQMSETTRRVLLAVIGLGYTLLLWLRPDNPLASNTGVMLASAALAWLIGRGLRAPSAVIVFVITAGLVDFFSFSGGLTQQIVQASQNGASNLLDYLALRAYLGGRWVPVMGIGDLAVMGAVVAALMRLGYAQWLVVLLPLAGLLLAIVVGTLVGGIYGLPFMAVTVLVGLQLVAEPKPPT